MANMAIEAGGKAGLFHVDQKTLDYIKPRCQPSVQGLRAGRGCQFSKVIEWDVTKMEPQVSMPYLPSNTKPVSQVARLKSTSRSSELHQRQNQPTCASRRDFEGKKVHPRVRTIVIPAPSRFIWTRCTKGWWKSSLMQARSSAPDCGPCLGGYMGILAAGEKPFPPPTAIFVGRMGSTKSESVPGEPGGGRQQARLPAGFQAGEVTK